MPGAALAVQKHGGSLALRQQRHLMGELLHRGGAAERVEPRPGRGLSEQRLVHAAEAHLVGHARGRRREVRHVDRLGEEILRAELHRADGGGNVAVAGEQNDGSVPLAQVLQNLHAVHAGESEVEDDDIGTHPVEGGQPGLAAQLPGDLVAQALEVVTDARSTSTSSSISRTESAIYHDPATGWASQGGAFLLHLVCSRNLALTVKIGNSGRQRQAGPSRGSPPAPRWP